MIEQAIYFALGCCVTGLLALLFAPVFWQRALRLTRQRLQLQVPLSMQEILAERDQLRAQFAVERLRIEQTCEAVEASKGHDMAEIGRRTMEIAALTEEIETLKETVSIQAKALEEAHSTRDDRAVQIDGLNVSLHENTTKMADYRKRAETAETERSHLLSETDSQRTSVASLTTVNIALEIRLADAERALANEREAATALRSRLETAMEHAARHESAGLLVRRELDDVRMQRRQLEADLAAAQTAVKTMREEHERAVVALEGARGEHEKTALTLRSDLDDSRRRAGKALAGLEAAQIDLQEARLREEEAIGKLAAVADPDGGLLEMRRELEEARSGLRQRENDLRTAENALSEARERQEAATRPAQRIEDAAAAEDARAARLDGDVLPFETASADLAPMADRLQADGPTPEVLEAERQALRAQTEETSIRLAAAEAARDAAVLDLARFRERDEAAPSMRQQLDAANARARQLQNELGTAQASLDEATRERQTAQEGQSATALDHANADRVLRRELEEARAQAQKLDEKLNQANILLGEARETLEQHRLGATADRTRGEASVAATAAENERLKQDLTRSGEEIAQIEAMLAAASEREKAAALQRSLETDRERRTERRYKDRLEVLAAENDALKEALHIEEEPRSFIAPDASDADDAGLRASIHALGVAVADLTRAAQPPATDPRRSRKDESPRPQGVA